MLSDHESTDFNLQHSYIFGNRYSTEEHIIKNHEFRLECEATEPMCNLCVTTGENVLVLRYAQTFVSAIQGKKLQFKIRTTPTKSLTN